MPYYEVTPYELYPSCLSGWDGGKTLLDRACAWVEAVNTYDVHELHAQVFRALESGEAYTWVPDLHWKPKFPPEQKRPPTMELAHEYVGELEADYEIERGRFPEGRGPDFKRLPPPARLRFLQLAYDVQLARGQILEEARRRLAAGEVLPPPKDA